MAEYAYDEYMKQTYFHRRGFTLLELLVVISIIGILLAVGATAFSTAQKKGRDSRRRSDIKALQNAFEQYYAQNESYASCSTMASGIISGGFSAVTDPKSGADYSSTCTVKTDNTGYCVCAALEETTKGNASTGGADGSCDWSAGGSYFCAQNLQ